MSAAPHASAPPLAVLVCGSVDDGKSTLIGRLLTECGAVNEDQQADDLAHLTDGLEAEREQGITIDVAHRQFHTGLRRVHLLDCPGHEQYTRNMATAASQAELAVVLVDAATGLRPQTARHVRIARMMGVRAVLFVVNKMDLVGFDPAAFHAIVAALDPLAPGSLALPACARDGDNVVQPGSRMGWHAGPTLLQALDAHEAAVPLAGAFRMPVQLVLRPPGGERLLAGTVARGRIEVGALVAVSGSGTARVCAIAGPAGPQHAAEAREAVSIVLDEPLDAGRGVVLSDAAAPARTARAFQAGLVWCDEAPLLPGRTHRVKLGTAVQRATVTRILHAVDVETGLPRPAAELALNAIGVVELEFAAPVAYERFADCPALGGFIVLDAGSGATLAAGVIDAALTRADHVPRQPLVVDRAARGGLLGQRPAVVWFTGLSGAGKSTLASRLDAELHGLGRATYVLDGDNLRHGLNRDLGFSPADRVENVRRVSEVAALMADAGLIVLVCLISPYRADRAAARERTAAAFIEVFVDAPVAECRRRDPKGLYAKADSGEIPEFTGVSAPYEAPERPDIHVRTDQEPVDAGIERLLDRILGRRR